MDKGNNMSTKMMRHIVVGALTSGAIAAAGLALGAGSAAAQDPTGTWCPGQPTPLTTATFDWDMGVCHDYWYVNPGEGNVKITDNPTGMNIPGYIWIGGPPPWVPPLGPPPPPPPPPAPGSYCDTNPIGCHFFGPYGPGYQP
jgi:hypothetical protein